MISANEFQQYFHLHFAYHPAQCFFFSDRHFLMSHFPQEYLVRIGGSWLRPVLSMCERNIQYFLLLRSARSRSQHPQQHQRAYIEHLHIHLTLVTSVSKLVTQARCGFNVGKYYFHVSYVRHISSHLHSDSLLQHTKMLLPSTSHWTRFNCFS